MTKSIGIENFSLCPECGGFIAYSHFRGEEACSQCGLVTNERIFSTSHHGKKDLFDNERITTPAYIKIKSYLSYDKKRALKKNAWYLSDSYNKNLLEACASIKRICGGLKLPKVINYKSVYLYKKALKKKLVHGQSIQGIACACIFYISQKDFYRSIKEIASQIKGLVKKSKNEERHITKCYSLIVNELNLKYQSRTLASRVIRFISEAGLDITLIPIVTKYLEHCNAESVFSGMDPNGVIAAAIYIIGKKHGYNITQILLAKIASVTENTIRSRIREFKKNRKINLKKQYSFPLCTKHKEKLKPDQT